MKKNTIKRIAGIATAAVMAVSTAAFTAVTASASGPNNNRTTVSFEPCGDWRACGAKMTAYFFNSQNNQSEEAALIEKGDTLYTYASGTYDKVVFMRKSPDGEIWNQTYDLTIENNKTFKATGFEGKFYTGSWQGEQKAYSDPQSISFVPSKEWKQDGARFAAYLFNEYTGKSTWANVEQFSATSDYYTVNTTNDYTHVIFVRLPGNAANSFDQAWNKTPNIRISKIQGAFYATGWEQDVNADGYNEFWA